MGITSVSTAFFNTQAATDLKRAQSQLADLQRQVGSERKANDLKGYGIESARILNVQDMITKTDARQKAAQSLAGRLNATDVALGGAADATEALRLAILDAIGQDNGQSLATNVQAAFDAAKQAFNTTFEGEAVFAGERIGAAPINIASLTALAAAPSTASIFDEASRAKTVDLGDGAFAVSPKASAVSTGLFDTLRQLKQLIDAAGGSLPSPLTSGQKTALQGFAATIGTARQTLLLAQGQNGALQEAMETKATALSAQSDALAKIAGDAANADLAEVATRITATQVQYEAIAQTFASLSKLSLLDYLR
jgi:flagellar hook-associated protein 3 FlgL